MNDRIRELAGQAGFDTEHHKWIFANDNAGEGECNELLEKFAKLIVSECMDVLDPGENQLIARFQARQWLAEHFGDE